MAGRVVVVESSGADGSALARMLQAAHFDVRACAAPIEAMAAAASDATDVMIIDLQSHRSGALALAEQVRADHPAIALVGLCPRDEGPLRIAALRAGMDDVLDHPVRENILLSRIRSLLRQADQRPGADLDRSAWRALGLAEVGGDFVPAGRVGLITARRDDLPLPLALLMDRLPGGTTILDPADDPGAAAPGPDLYLIDAVAGPGRTPADGSVLRILSDLRSRAATRHAATLVILPDDRDQLGAMALDLGADDLATPATSPEELAHRVRSLLRRKSMADRRRDRLQAGLQAAVTDPLTGLHNRRYAMAELDQMVERATLSGAQVAVMMLDIDHFKTVNDTHGHAMGDRVLVEVAARLRARLRAVDLIARIGGEEFLIAMPDATIEGARGVAERLRGVIEDGPFCAGQGWHGRGLRLTVSIGVAVCGADGCTDEGIAGIFARADRALYAAKAAGRNMVTMAASAA